MARITRSNTWIALIVALVVASFTKAARAQPAGLGYELRALTALNPLGARLDAEAVYHQAFCRSREPLFALNGYTARAGVGVSPAAFSPYVSLVLQPFSALDVSARYEAHGYFGTAGFARSYPSPRADYGRDIVSQPPDGPEGSTGAYALWVHKLTLGATVQALLGQVLLRSAWAFMLTEANLEGDDRVIYDPMLDTVVEAHGWAVKGDTDLAYAFSADLRTAILAGVRLTYVAPLYGADAFAPGEAEENLNRSTRLGPWVRWPLFRGEHDGVVDAMDLTLIAQFYLSDRFHTGGTTPSAVPMLGLVFSVMGH